MSSLDLLDRLLEHDAWTTQRVLELAQALDDAQLDAEFDIGHRTWRATARHMVGNIEVWTDLMAERPVRAMPAGAQTLSVLQARFAAAYRDFAAVARAARDAGRLNALYLDVLDQPPRAKTLGGTTRRQRFDRRGHVELGGTDTRLSRASWPTRNEILRGDRGFGGRRDHWKLPAG